MQPRVEAKTRRSQRWSEGKSLDEGRKWSWTDVMRSPSGVRRAPVALNPRYLTHGKKTNEKEDGSVPREFWGID